MTRYGPLNIEKFMPVFRRLINSGIEVYFADSLEELDDLDLCECSKLKVVTPGDDYPFKSESGEVYMFIGTNKPEIKSVSNSKEVNTMNTNMNESLKTIMSMKMIESIMKNEDKEQDLGKLYLMQQLTNGEPLQITDVIKSKLIKKFELDTDSDLPLEKVMLLQMLDGGQIDLTQLIIFKMMDKMFEEDK